MLYAVYNNHPLCARLLLEAGADLTVQTEGGHSPLSLAVALGYREGNNCLIFLVIKLRMPPKRT